MNREPTPDHIAASLADAKELVQRKGYDIIRALAEATSVAQRDGIEGFKVFRDTRSAVSAVLPKGVELPDFCLTAKRPQQVTALEQAILVVKS